MLTGSYSPPKILHIANNKWGFRTAHGKLLSRSGIYRIFTNPFYYGWFQYPQGSDNWYKGSHQLMITAQEYDKVQKLLRRNGRPRPNRTIIIKPGTNLCCIIRFTMLSFIMMFPLYYYSWLSIHSSRRQSQTARWASNAVLSLSFSHDSWGAR